METLVSIDYIRLASLLPALKADIRYLQALEQGQPVPTVMVLGKSGQGGASLLNGLVGDVGCFSEGADVSGARVQSETRNGVRWMMAADRIDRAALEAGQAGADVLLLVHSFRAGMLDEAEVALAQTLSAAQQRTGRPCMLVLTRRSEAQNPALEARLLEDVAARLPGMPVMTLGSVGYMQAAGAPGVLLRAPGMDALAARLARMLEARALSAQRQHGRAVLRAALVDALEALERQAGLRVKTLRETRQARARAYAAEMDALEQKILARFEEAGVFEP